jgi:hypothetical protein
VDADVIDIENLTEALKTSQYGVCVYESGNDVVDHQVRIPSECDSHIRLTSQVVNVEYEGGVTASMTMSACRWKAHLSCMC